MNRIGSILLEFGISFPRGHANMKNLFQWLADRQISVPPLLILELRDQLDYYNQLNERISAQDQKLVQLNKDNDLFSLLQTVPGIGPMTVSCCLSAVGNVNDFANGRNFAAWLGLVPFKHSTGRKPRLLGISKRGNKELRELFVHAARAVMWRDSSAERYFGSSQKLSPPLLLWKPSSFDCIECCRLLKKIDNNLSAYYTVNLKE